MRRHDRFDADEPGDLYGPEPICSKSFEETLITSWRGRFLVANQETQAALRAEHVAMKGSHGRIAAKPRDLAEILYCCESRVDMRMRRLLKNRYGLI